ncbi:MAG: type II toxin-antitoxin system prevent-host-death family antitoxin [Nitrospirae bacterium]|nr:type II toxin-antitoxin system prevent-host-death family antitoxin [Nitrospirota bacterium]
MIFANVRELKARASEFIRKARKTGGVVVVSHGKPTAALIPLDEDSFEEYLLEHHAGFRKALDRSFKEYRKKGGLPIERLIEETKREMGD